MLASMLEKLSENTTVSVAVIALTGVALSAFVSALVSRRSIYINAVTTERAKWIEKLRNNISQYAGTASYIAYKMHFDGSDFIKTAEAEKIMRDMDILETTIKLQLNPNSRIDANIIKLLETMPSLLDDGPSAAKYSAAEKLLVRHTQWLLKEEWEKVKYEARGPLRRAFGWPKRALRLRKYANFCDGEGSVSNEHIGAP